MSNSNLVKKKKGYIQFSNRTFTKIKTEWKSSRTLMDVQLCNFYFNVIKNISSKYLNKKLTKKKSLRGFLFRLRSQTNSWCVFKENSVQDTSFMYRLAWIFRNSTCLSSAVAQYFGSTLVQNSDILETLLNQAEIKICALGGGSAAEVVAIVRILQIIGNIAELHPDIYVTIVDVSTQWEMTCIDILQNIDYFCEFPERIKFLEVDSLDYLDTSSTAAVKEADIVTMVKILSETEKKLGWLKLERTVQDICCIIQNDSLFFVLDHPQASVVNACGGLYSKLPYCHLLHEETYAVHTLDESAVQLHVLLHSDLFGGILCNTSMNVFMRMWLKMDQPSPFIHYYSCCHSVLEAAKRLEDRKDYYLDCRAEYNSAKTSEKASYEEWKANCTEKMLKAGRTQKEINKAVLTWKENCKQKVSECKGMMERAFREFMSEVDTVCDFTRQHSSEEEILNVMFKYKEKKGCEAKRDKHIHSVLDALISLKENQSKTELDLRVLLG